MTGQTDISPQKTEAKWNMVFGAIAVLITAIPSGGTSIYLFVVLNGAWGIGQMAVSSMKLQELENGEYNTPGLDRAQKLLETTGNALAVVDLAFIAKSAGRHVMNLTVESARNEMLRNIKNPAVRAGLDKVGTKLEHARSIMDDINPANFARSGLELAGTGGRVTSQLVDGPQVWFSSGSGGTGKPNLSSGDLGELLGSGGNKNVYAYGEDKAVGVLKDGKKAKLITVESDLLNKLDELGLPTVNGQSIFVDGKDALMFDRYAQSSKDIVKLHDGKVRIVGESSLLNQQSIEDLTSIRRIMVEKKIKIEDLQFLIGKDGRVVVSDLLNVEAGKKVKPSKNNLRMIDLLIESAKKNLKY
ncbi:hypothetical protein J25TS5_37280 [Paenibacillus faecis]|uniref:hypothetical protein n=1 Tax=Paenibacillus faecis TaxID=862114 RepID=UPI001B0F6F8C|nr:hypothetical protein [Paenibacillus faecis]GIO86796.1 hypothetical protein J25TS5_37280 [Paenibacillus faecis]